MIEAAERAGLLKPGGVDRRADERQHRRWTGAGRGRQGISVHLRDGRQAVRGEARAAARVRRGGRHLPHRRQPGRRAVVLPRLRPAGARDARRLEAGPVPQRQRTPRRTTPPPGRRSGRRPRAASRTSWSRSGPAGRSPAPAATSRSGTRRSSWSEPTRRARSTPANRPPPYLTEGIGEDFWPSTYEPEVCDVVVRVSDRDSMLTARTATAARGHPDGRVVRHRAVGRASAGARRSTTRTRCSSSCCPTRAGTTSASCTPTPGCGSTGLLGADEQVADYDWRRTTAETVLRGAEIPRPAP